MRVAMDDDQLKMYRKFVCKLGIPSKVAKVLGILNILRIRKNGGECPVYTMRYLQTSQCLLEFRILIRPW